MNLSDVELGNLTNANQSLKEALAPRSKLERDAAQEGWITNLPQWFAFMEAQNLTSHVYKDEVAESVFAIAKEFPKYVDELISNIEKSLRT